MATKHAQILEVTYRLFAEVGIEKTSMARIAKEVGITKPAVYYYFPSKGSLTNSLFQYLIKEIQFENFFKIATYTRDNFKQQLLNDGLAMIQQQAADPYYEKVMSEYYVLSAKDANYALALKDVLHHFLEGFIRLFDQAAELHLINPEDVHLRAQFLTLVVDGLDKYADKEYNLDPRGIWYFAVESVLTK